MWAAEKTGTACLKCRASPSALSSQLVSRYVSRYAGPTALQGKHPAHGSCTWRACAWPQQPALQARPAGQGPAQTPEHRAAALDQGKKAGAVCRAGGAAAAVHVQKLTAAWLGHACKRNVSRLVAPDWRLASPLISAPDVQRPAGQLSTAPSPPEAQPAANRLAPRACHCRTSLPAWQARQCSPRPTDQPLSSDLVRAVDGGDDDALVGVAPAARLLQQLLPQLLWQALGHAVDLQHHVTCAPEADVGSACSRVARAVQCCQRGSCVLSECPATQRHEQAQASPPKPQARQRQSAGQPPAAVKRSTGTALAEVHERRQRPYLAGATCRGMRCSCSSPAVLLQHL